MAIYVCVCVCARARACLVVYGRGSVITSVVDGPCMDLQQASFAIQSNTQTQEMQMQLYCFVTGSVKQCMVVK